MPKQDIQLTQPSDFSASSVIFDKCSKRTVPNSDVAYYSANVKMRYPDGSEGPIIFQLPRCPTFGIGNKFGDSLDKLSLSVILGEKDYFGDEHKSAVKAINDLVQACKNFTLTDDVKNTIGQYELEERDLKNMSPLAFQRDRETKKLLLDKPPILNVKLMLENDKESGTKKVKSRFYNEDEYDEQGLPISVDPREYIGKFGYCTCLIKFESIYYGSKIKLQVKIYECEMKTNDSGFKSLLRANKPMIKTSINTSALSAAAVANDDVEDEQDDEEENSSVAVSAQPQIYASDDEDVEETSSTPAVVEAPKPVVAVKPVRRTGAGKK